MENKHFKQENGYGCGLYALANIFNNAKIINEKRLEDSKKGNHIGQLNKWLEEDGKNLFLEPLFFTSLGKKLPKSICGIKVSGDGVLSIPLLMDIQFVKDGKMHMVAAELLTNGQLLVMDSLKDDLELTTISEYNKKHYRCFGVWYFRSYTEEGWFMRLKH